MSQEFRMKLEPRLGTGRWTECENDQAASWHLWRCC